MATKQYKVVKGEKGYVPVYSNSHGGTNLGKAVNGLIVYVIVGSAEEYGYVQIDERVIQDALPEVIKVSDNKGQYWIEKSHLEELTVVPPSGDVVKYQLLNVDYSVVPPVVTLKKL